ncbi:MAG: D-2-hydroxyacid dehydrogenase [Chloroflexi bacterium]|nr:D-2-hydroxyacid dehydrogenase [Chloroflexota bacterium]
MPKQAVVVGVGSNVGPGNLARIAAVSERIRVVDLVPLLYALETEAYRPGQARPQLPDGPATLEALGALAGDCEVLIARSVPRALWGMTPALRWVQAPTVGTDLLAASGIRARSDVTLVVAAGVNAVSVSEWALSAILALCKQTPRLMAAQRQKVWLRADLEELAGKTVGVVGLGQIGRRIAQMCKAFGTTVLGLRRSASGLVPGIDELLPPDGLNELLDRSDIVVLAAPLTAETRGMIDAAALQRMGPTAYLVNLGRGPLVDEAALIAALRAGVIAGAALDVFDQEPLPPSSPLWEMPNVFLTAHVGGLTRQYDNRVTDLFVENLTRYLNGEPLQGAVDWERGY